MIEKYPLEEAAEGYARMMSGDAQYRVVLTVKQFLLGTRSCGWEQNGNCRVTETRARALSIYCIVPSRG
jgi:hypothetical protein